MTSVWLGHNIWAVIVPEPLQTFRGGTNTPSSLLWNCWTRESIGPKICCPMQIQCLCLHCFSYLLTLTFHVLPKPQKLKASPGPPGLPLLTALKLSCRENSRNWRLPCWLHFRTNIMSQKSWPISSRCSHESIWPKMFHNEMNCCFTVITEWKFTIPVIHLDHNISKALWKCKVLW